MIPKRFDLIAKADIDALVTDAVSEGRTIEYKRDLPSRSDDGKREFLADVSSFANAAGGDIVYGIEEDNGVPTSANGLGGIDPDAESLRLDNCIRDGIAPRVPGLQIKAVGGFLTGPVLVLRVPKSWFSPHLVTFRNWSRFFSRTNAGKFQMDVTEIRSAFVGSEDLPERVKQFRDERLARIVAGETPISLWKGAKLVLHLLPIASFSSSVQLDLSLIRQRQISFPPLSASGWDRRFNVDGLVTFAGLQSDRTSRSYCQVFRSGRVETVWAEVVTKKGDFSFIPSIAYERYLISSVEAYLDAMRKLDVPCPIVIVVSVLNAAGACMDPEITTRCDVEEPIDRDVLLLPDVLVEEYGCDVPRVLRPIFDAVWNATGFERSLNYNEQGEWRAWS